MNNLIVQIPKYSVEETFQSFSESYDWGLLDLHIPEVHKITQGEGIKIAIVDSGKSEHFEVKNNTVAAKNCSNSPYLEDKQGHSTAVSGIIAAEQNGEGVVGVAPKAQLYFAKAMDDSGAGSPSALVKAIDWSISQRVDIISISAGLFSDFKPLHQVIKKAYAKNIITVSACGNSSNRYYDIAFPARYPEVIGVAAYDQKRQVASFSSRGANISFAMPGVGIYTTYPPNTYARLNGSSFSCPILSGICALILSKHRKNQGSTPCNTPQQMLEHLKKYAIKLGEKNDTGFGTVDLDKLFSET